VSPATAVGIVVTVVLAISLVVVGVMFWWGAREDGRDQARIDAELRKSRDRRPSEADKP
jgi:hypothetical protein